MPDEFIVIVSHRRENVVASVCMAELVFARRHTFDGDEKPTAFGDPLWDCVRQLFADGQIHVTKITKGREETQLQGGAGSPLPAAERGMTFAIPATHERRARSDAPYLPQASYSTQFHPGFRSSTRCG